MAVITRFIVALTFVKEAIRREIIEFVFAYTIDGAIAARESLKEKTYISEGFWPRLYNIGTKKVLMKMDSVQKSFNCRQPPTRRDVAFCDHSIEARSFAESVKKTGAKTRVVSSIELFEIFITKNINLMTTRINFIHMCKKMRRKAVGGCHKKIISLRS